MTTKEFVEEFSQPDTKLHFKLSGRLILAHCCYVDVYVPAKPDKENRITIRNRPIGHPC